MAILSQLTYFPLPMPQGVTLAEFVRDYAGSLTDKQRRDYQTTFDAIRNDPNGLGSLKIATQEKHPDTGFSATLFVTPNKEAIVAFQGTNVGVNADTVSVVSSKYKELTMQQEAALGFMERNVQGKGYRNVSVTGHSQGGQLAQTVALLSIGVSKCVVFNSVGFNDRFLRVYRKEINANAGKITSYKALWDRVVDRSYAQLVAQGDIPGSNVIKNFDVRGHDISGWVDNFWNPSSPGFISSVTGGAYIVGRAIVGTAFLPMRIVNKRITGTLIIGVAVIGRATGAISNWWNKNFSAGHRAASDNPQLTVDTRKLNGYADRLERQNHRLASLDIRLNSLYREVGLLGIFNLLRTDIKIGRSKQIDRVQLYLRETSAEFARVERELIAQL